MKIKGKEGFLALLFIGLTIGLHLAAVYLTDEGARFGWNPIAIMQKFLMAAGGLFLSLWIVKVASHLSIGFYKTLEDRWSDLSYSERLPYSVYLMIAMLVTFALIFAGI